MSLPSSVDIGLEGGSYTNFVLTDPAGFAPAAFTFSGLGLTGAAFDVRFNHFNEWLMVSEVSFDAAVPEPATGLLLLSGIATAIYRRRRLA